MIGRRPYSTLVTAGFVEAFGEQIAAERAVGGFEEDHVAAIAASRDAEVPSQQATAAWHMGLDIDAMGKVSP
jgi:hypothetical protein